MFNEIGILRRLEKAEVNHVARLVVACWISAPSLAVIVTESAGRSVSTLVDHDDHCISIQLASTVFMQIAKALSHLHHEMSLCHRDVSPGNICWSEKKGMATLIDFEYSADCSQAIPRGGNAVGTLGFIAPEIFLEEEYNGNI